MKRCNRCRRVRPADDFALHRQRPDGRQDECRDCGAERYRERQSKKGLSARARVKAQEGYKYCPGCREISPLSNWHRNVSARDGYVSYCKDCRRRQGEADHLRRTFGLTIEERDSLYASQDGLCAICRKRSIKHIDHDHPTGKVRGGLCGPCNMGLGQFEDEPQRLRAAARYLELHRNPTLRLVVDQVRAPGESILEVNLRTHLAS
jgi:hypothetical protein